MDIRRHDRRRRGSPIPVGAAGRPALRRGATRKRLRDLRRRLPRYRQQAPHLHPPVRTNHRPVDVPPAVAAAVADLRGGQQDEEGPRDQVPVE
ncbi:hypothetical protein BHE74_00014558 [Ensete ventricosum]|nr:hypothetical protein BHE74_00014558 [Ensete ventricosum]